MSAAVALLERCRAAGIVLELEGQRIVADAPATAEADALLAEVEALRAEVLTALAVADPRPDLADDTALWAVVLRRAAAGHGHEPDGVFGALHGVRCAGARIVQQGPGYRIVAGTEYAGDWEADRATWLLPHKNAVAAILKGLAK